MESQDSFRDLFEEAPIAYLYESVDSRIIRANRTAMRILGIKPEEAEGMMGKSLLADAPDTHERLLSRLKRSGAGSRRAEWCSNCAARMMADRYGSKWWSRPVPGGKFTRTMFIDITDSVLLEQEKSRLEAQNAYLLDEIRSEQNFGDIIGSSVGMRKVMEKVKLVAPTNATVIITGESGTGKELVARAIHEHSGRTASRSSS